MKNKFILLLIIRLLLANLMFAQLPYTDKNWEVVFQDSFNIFNTSLWQKTHNQVHGNYIDNTEEQQVYHMNNAYIENEKLVLKTQKLTNYFPCPNGNNCQYNGLHKYLSGQIMSNIPYKYGYYEIYAKLPGSKGYWPAFWFWNEGITNSNCWYNEIDIFEALGCDINNVSNNVWYGFNCPPSISYSLKGITYSCNYTTGYHWYGVEWNNNKITWYIDRHHVREVHNNMGGIGIQNTMFIIINIALTPKTQNYSCQTDTSTIFPNYMYIDQANAYRLKCDVNTVVNNIYNYDTFYYAVKKSISVSTPIPVGKNISLRATDFIELKAGFETPLGAELYIGINSCE